MIDYTKEPWEINLGSLSRQVYIEAETPLGVVAIAKVFDLAGNHGTREGNAALLRAAPEMAEFLLSSYQHVSHGGPKRGDLEDLLRKIGLIA